MRPFAGGLLTALLLMFFLHSCSEQVKQTTVFEDGFSALSPGILDGESAWQVATSLRHEGFEQAWQVRGFDQARELVQTFSNLDGQNEPLSLITHPLVVAGDSLWDNYTIEVEFTPLDKFDKCGVVFGYQHANDFFFFGTEGNTITLKQVMPPVTPLRPIERILEYRPLVWSPGTRMSAVVSVRRNKITAIINDSIRMYTETSELRPGKVGLISDMPASFHRVEVRMLNGELRKLNRKRRQLERYRDIHMDAHPLMIHWKTLNLEECGGSRICRLADLTGDGNRELVLAGVPDQSSGRLVLTAMNLGGEILWQRKLGKAGREVYSGEWPLHVHDLDGDGKREVLYIQKRQLRILDGGSGENSRSFRLPVNFNVSSLLFGDLLGTGRDNCLVITDGKENLAVLNEKGEHLWSRKIDGGSHPMLHDMNGDGLVDILVGYSVFDHKGDRLFHTGAFIGDDCEGVSVSELVQGEKRVPTLLYAAGDWGIMHVDLKGKVQKQNVIGHVSHMTVAELDLERPGLELIATNALGSRGLVHILSGEGEVLDNFVAAEGMNRSQAVNWKGDGEEFFLMSADTLHGGLLDVDGRIAVAFPSDGHPYDYYSIADLYGDARDEILVWDDRELWIYSQDDNPRMGKTYSPQRIPFYNYSSLQMNRSTPGR